MVTLAIPNAPESRAPTRAPPLLGLLEHDTPPPPRHPIQSPATAEATSTTGQTARITAQVAPRNRVEFISAAAAAGYRKAGNCPSPVASCELENVPHDIEIQLKLLQIRFPYHLLDHFSQRLLTLL